jgi:hypothetical protein
MGSWYGACKSQVARMLVVSTRGKASGLCAPPDCPCPTPRQLPAGPTSSAPMSFAMLAPISTEQSMFRYFETWGWGFRGWGRSWGWGSGPGWGWGLRVGLVVGGGQGVGWGGTGGRVRAGGWRVEWVGWGVVGGGRFGGFGGAGGAARVQIGMAEEAWRCRCGGARGARGDPAAATGRE